MELRVVLFGFAAVLAAGSPAAAQVPQPLTLDEALLVAQRNNPAYQRAQFQVQATELGVRSGWGQFLPSLTAQVNWGASSRTQLTGTNDFGESVALPSPVTFKSSSATQSLGGSITLFDGLANVKTLQAAKYDVSAAAAGVNVQGLQVTADVSQRFYSAIRADRLIDVEAQLLQAANDRLDGIQRLFQVTGATQVDVLGAQVDVEVQALALERQNAGAKQARLQVLESIGVLGDVLDFEPDGTFPAVFDPGMLAGEQLVQRALTIHPVIAQRDFQVSSNSKTASAARGSWLPTLDLSGSLSRGSNQQGFGAVYEFNPRDDSGYGFQLGLSWPIFNGFQRQQQIGQADVNRRQAEEDLREAKLQVEQRVRATLIDLETAYEALLTQRRSTDLSRRRGELAREQYLIGASGMTFTNLQQIIEGNAREERALVEADYQFALALVDLELQVGEQVRPQ